MNWLSYGGGVNSTALAILLSQGQVPGIEEDWEPIFADTGNEKDETYRFLEDWMQPWFREIGKPLVIVKPPETVLERWQRQKVTGSRRIRSCTREAKIKPVAEYIAAHGGGTQLIGIDAGEAHRTRPFGDEIARRWPLVELDVDRAVCVEIINSVRLPVPMKSGCWHCPFMRVGEVLSLARLHPERFALIEQLEKDATTTHGPGPNGYRTQWGEKPASYWRERAVLEDAQEEFRCLEPPCGCYDGDA